MELSTCYGGHLSAVVQLLLQSQQAGAWVAWVGSAKNVAYPPDLAEAGVDLQALVMIFAPDPQSAGSAVVKLLHSGAFALIILDLAAWGKNIAIPMALQSRMAAWARKHHAMVVALTRKSVQEPSLGPLITVRVQVEHARWGIYLEIIKDKSAGPGLKVWQDALPPTGLRQHPRITVHQGSSLNLRNIAVAAKDQALAFNSSTSLI